MFHELGSDKVCVDVSYRDVGPARLAELAIPAAALRDVNTMAQRLPVDNCKCRRVAFEAVGKHPFSMSLDRW